MGPGSGADAQWPQIVNILQSHAPHSNHYHNQHGTFVLLCPVIQLKLSRKPGKKLANEQMEVLFLKLVLLCALLKTNREGYKHIELLKRTSEILPISGIFCILLTFSAMQKSFKVRA